MCRQDDSQYHSMLLQLVDYYGQYYHLAHITISKHILIAPSPQLNPHPRPPSLNKKPHHPRPRRNLHLSPLPSSLIPPLSIRPSLPPFIIRFIGRFIFTNAPPLLVFGSGNGIPFVGFENEFYGVREDVEEAGYDAEEGVGGEG